MDIPKTLETQMDANVPVGTGSTVTDNKRETE